MSYHHKNLFSINYKIQSLAISKPPTIVNHQVNGVQQKNDKDHVVLILTAPPSISNVVVNLDVLPHEAEELQKMYREERYLVLSFNRIVEEDDE